MSRPGMMIYFDMAEGLEQLDDAELGALIRAALQYARHGKLPEQSGAARILWPLVRSAIDRDAERYEQKCESGRYAVYVRECNKANETPLSFECWRLDRNNERLSTDNERYPTTTTTPTTTPTTTQTTATNSTAISDTAARTFGSALIEEQAQPNRDEWEAMRRRKMQAVMESGAPPPASM